MTDTTTTKPPATAATSTGRQRGTARPTVSVRPAAVGAVNAATIAGATVVAAGGGAILAAGAGALALGATAVGARKKGQARQAKSDRTITFTRSSGGGSTGRGGGLGRSGVGSPGSKSAGSRSGGSGGGRSGGGGGQSRSGKPRGGGMWPVGGGSGGGRSKNGKTPDGRSNRTGGGGHRRAGSTPGSSSRSPLTADKVAAARRKLANRRQAGPRLSDAIRSATKPATTPYGATGKKPTAREAFRTARRVVTGDNPKRRGTVRRAAAGLVAGGIAAGKAAYDSRQRRKKRDAARQAKNDRIAARQQPGVGTTVRRAANAADQNTSTRKPAPMPVRTQLGPYKGTVVLTADATCSVCGGLLPAKEWVYRTRKRGVIGQCCGHHITAEDVEDPTCPTISEGLITMTHPLLAISEDFLAAAARNQPEGMLQVTAEAHLLPLVMENIVKAMKIRFDRAQDHPLHESIKDMYGLVHKAQVSVQQAAEEIGPAIEKIHEHELNRLRNQRVGEDMWDVARNRGQL